MKYLRWNPRISPVAVAIKEAPHPPPKKAAANSLFNLCFTMPNYGIGMKFTRDIWKIPGMYWEIAQVKPWTQVNLLHKLK